MTPAQSRARRDIPELTANTTYISAMVQNAANSTGESSASMQGRIEGLSCSSSCIRLRVQLQAIPWLTSQHKSTQKVVWMVGFGLLFLLSCAQAQNNVYLFDAQPVSGPSPADGYEVPHLLAAVSGDFASSIPHLNSRFGKPQPVRFLLLLGAIRPGLV